MDFWILSTDYQTFTLAYSCENLSTTTRASKSYNSIIIIFIIFSSYVGTYFVLTLFICIIVIFSLPMEAGSGYYIPERVNPSCNGCDYFKSLRYHRFRIDV